MQITATSDKNAHVFLWAALSDLLFSHIDNIQTSWAEF